MLIENIIQQHECTIPFENPPIISGLDFPISEIVRCKRCDPPRLLTLDIETSLRCNLKCKYCYSNGGRALPNEIGPKILFDVIEQAADLGAKMIVVVGGGEPMCYPQFKELLNVIEDNGMRALIFTNLTQVDKKWASFFWDRQISIAGKINSFIPKVHDFLVGVQGAAKKAYDALNLLLEVGYPSQDRGSPLLAIETVLLKQNLSQIPEMWRYCRSRKIIPYFEMVTEQGRLLDNPELLADSYEVMDMFKHVLEIDQTEFNYSWIPRPPIASYNCTRHYFGNYLHVTGELYPCPGVEVNLGNVKEKPLKEILDSDELRVLRNIDRHLEGRCGSCAHSKNHIGCYGCRGQAWQMSGSITAEDPDCRLYTPVSKYSY